MMERKDWYAICVMSMSIEDFEKIFGVKPVDIWSFDYDFDREVTWNQNFEIAYQEYLDNDYECNDEDENDDITQIDLSDYDDDDDFYLHDFYEEYEPQEMTCDLTGYCGGTSCPNWYKCHY